MNQFSKWAMHVKRTGPSGALLVRLGLAAALAALIAALYLAQASEMSTTGRRLEALRENYNRLKRINAELSYQISQEGSIPRLQQRSADLGLIPAERVEYLSVPTLPPVDCPGQDLLNAQVILAGQLSREKP
jgi:hypothetical protein